MWASFIFFPLCSFSAHPGASTPTSAGSLQKASVLRRKTDP